MAEFTVENGGAKGSSGSGQKNNYSKGELKENAKAYVRRYYRKIEERDKTTAKEFLWESIKKDYGADPESKWFEKIATKLDPIVFPSFYPPKPNHLLFEGPAGTGKSLLMIKFVKSLGGSPIEINSSQIRSPQAIENAYEAARVYRRALVEEAVEFNYKENNEDGFFVEKIIATVAENLIEASDIEFGERREEVKKELTKAIFSVISSKENLIKYMSPLSNTEAIDINNRLSESIEEHLEKFGEEGKKLEEFINDKTMLSAVNLEIPTPPVIVLIDEIDSIGNRNNSNNPALNQLLTSLDGAAPANYSHAIATVAATNVIGLLDEALIREGRFERVVFPYPSLKARKKITDIMINDSTSKELKFEKGVNEIIPIVPLTTGADIMGMVKKITRDARSSSSLRGKLKISVEKVVKFILNSHIEETPEIGHSILIRGREYYLSKILGEETMIDEKTIQAEKWIKASNAFSKLVKGIIKEGEDEIDAYMAQNKEYEVFSRYPFMMEFMKITELLALDTLLGKGREIRILGEEIADLISLSVMINTVNYIVNMFREEKRVVADPYLVAEVDLVSTVGGIVGETEKNLKRVFGVLKTLGNAVVLLKGIEEFTHQRSYSAEGNIEVIKRSISDLVKSGMIVIYTYHSNIRTPSSPKDLVKYSGLLHRPNALPLALLSSELDLNFINRRIERDTFELSLSRNPDSIKYFGMHEYLQGYVDKDKGVLDREAVEKYKETIAQLNTLISSRRNSLKRLEGKLKRA